MFFFSSVLFSFLLSGPEASKSLLDFEDLYQTPSERLAYFKSLQMRNFLGSGSDSPVLNLVDSQYVISVSIGSPGQVFRMIPDITTETSWVPSASCSSLACLLHSRYKKFQSSSHSPSSTMFSQTYGSGKVSGSVFQDTLKVENLLISRSVLGETYLFEGPSWLAALFDGVLSLQSVLKSVLLSDKSLSNRLELKSRSGKLSTALGSCSSGFNFVQANASKSFEVESQGLWLGQQRILKELKLVFDLQTPLILFDRTMYALITNKIKVDAKCKNLHELPSLKIMLMGVSVVIGPSEYVLRVENDCMLGIVTWEFPESWEGTVVVGNSILQKYGICMDYDRELVGWKEK